MRITNKSAAATVRVAAVVVLLAYSWHCVQTSIVDYDEEDEIIILNETNFDKAVKEFKYLFVEFYAPWCTHCKKLQPEFTKASQLLDERGSSIRLAKVDATAEKALADRFSVRGYPTIKLFRDHSTEKSVDFLLKQTAGEMLGWLKKKTEMPFIPVERLEESQQMIDDLDVVVFGFFQDMKTPEAQAFAEVADSVDEVLFAGISKPELFQQYSASDKSVVIFKKLTPKVLTQFDEGRVELKGSELTVEAIQKLVEHHQVPLVIEYNPDSAPKIFARSRRVHVIMFISKDSSAFPTKLDELKQVATNFRGKALFIYIDVDPEQHKRILDFFGLKRSSCPTYRIFELDGSLKFKPDSDELSADELEQFVTEVLEHKRTPHLLSEEIPSGWDAKPVKELVGKNFDQVARDKTKDVIVEFYAPWCNFCKELVPTWEELGDKFKDSDHVIVAKLDATINEVDGIKVHQFPSIKFFPKDSDEIFDFPNSVNKTLDNLVKFVELKGLLPVDYDSKNGSSDGKQKDEL